MKKLILYSSLLLIILSACKKNNPPSLKEKLIGFWSYTSSVTKFYLPDGKFYYETSKTPILSYYIQFNSDGTYSSDFGISKTSGTYKITSDTTLEITVNGNPVKCRIETRSENNLIFISEGFYLGDKPADPLYIETSYNLTK